MEAASALTARRFACFPLLLILLLLSSTDKVNLGLSFTQIIALKAIFDNPILYFIVLHDLFGMLSAYPPLYYILFRVLYVFNVYVTQY